MKLKKILGFALFAVMLTTSCKKSDSGSTSTSVVDAAGHIVLPSDIAGALYAIHTKQSGGGSSFDIQSTFAWFGSAGASVAAGTVTCESDPLTQYIAGSWYQGTGMGIFDVTTNHIAWSVQGNAATGVPAFTYTDVAPMPLSFTFTTNSSSVNLANNLTINFSALPSNIAAVAFGLQGDYGTKNFGVAGNTSTSYTFSSADLKAVAKPGSQIAVVAMPIITTPVTLSGKKYYFVKQFEIEKIYSTL
jgi:hypothetical protein